MDTWLPWDNDKKTENLEYQNKDLTTLINNYREEMSRNRELFNERLKMEEKIKAKKN